MIEVIAAIRDYGEIILYILVGGDKYTCVIFPMRTIKKLTKNYVLRILSTYSLIDSPVSREKFIGSIENVSKRIIYTDTFL